MPGDPSRFQLNMAPEDFASPERDGRWHPQKGWDIAGWQVISVGNFFRPAWENRQNGFRISFDFGLGKSDHDINEHKVALDHQGTFAYETRDIPNLGEAGFPVSETARIILTYQGLWGGYWQQNPSPDGPGKDSMWIHPDPTQQKRGSAMMVQPWLRWEIEDMERDE